VRSGDVGEGCARLERSAHGEAALREPSGGALAGRGRSRRPAARLRVDPRLAVSARARVRDSAQAARVHSPRRCTAGAGAGPSPPTGLELAEALVLRGAIRGERFRGRSKTRRLPGHARQAPIETMRRRAPSPRFDPRWPSVPSSRPVNETCWPSHARARTYERWGFDDSLFALLGVSPQGAPGTPRASTLGAQRVSTLGAQRVSTLGAQQVFTLGAQPAPTLGAQPAPTLGAQRDWNRSTAAERSISRTANETRWPSHASARAYERWAVARSLFALLGVELQSPPGTPRDSTLVAQRVSTLGEKRIPTLGAQRVFTLGAQRVFTLGAQRVFTLGAQPAPRPPHGRVRAGCVVLASPASR
jgi:hypothetical protein